MHPSIQATLKEVQRRPQLYLHRISILSLRDFIMGFRFGLEVEQIEDWDQYVAFQPWIEAKFSVQKTLSWARIILNESQDEEEAFYAFFAYYQEYLESLK
ncbi:MAG: hypothetical protein AAFP92_27490 [Bacteroidota bacterium]